MLDVPAELVLYVAKLLAGHRREIGTRRGTRALTCRRPAKPSGVLAAQAPDLREAPERAREQGLPQLILDGKVVAADRCQEKTISRKGQEIDRWYPGKAHGFLDTRTRSALLRSPRRRC